MTSKYDRGDVVRTQATFTDPFNGDAAIDPSTVYLSVRPSHGQTTTYTYGVDSEVVKDGVGIYHADIDVDTAGDWHFRWWSTGSGKASEESRVVVEQPKAI